MLACVVGFAVGAMSLCVSCSNHYHSHHYDCSKLNSQSHSYLVAAMMEKNAINEHKDPDAILQPESNINSLNPSTASAINPISTTSSTTNSNNNNNNNNTAHSNIINLSNTSSLSSSHPITSTNGPQLDPKQAEIQRALDCKTSSWL